MSAMSASSAAPAGLMPLSLIAEHKTAQPPPAVQPLPRSGSDKCGTPAGISKPTANGMEGPGPLPLVSQLPQTTTALPVMTELSTQQHTANPASVSDSAQPAASLSYQAPHQNLVKPTETAGTAQEGNNGSSFTGSGGIGTSMLSGERRHAAEETTVQHHHMSSTTTSTFSSTMSSTTIEHSRSAITAQLLQLQPSQPGSHQSKDTTNTSTALGNTATSSPEIIAASAPVQPVTTTVTHLEESTTRVQESTSTTQVTVLESATLNRQTVQQSPPGESIPPTQTTPIQQSGANGTKQSESSPSVPPTNINSPPKSAQVQQISQPNAGSGTNPAVTTTSTHQSASSTSTTTTASVQPPPTESTLKVATLPRQTTKRPSKNASSSATATSETSKKSTGADTSKDKDSSVAGDKPRRKRLPTQPYQSPIPELNIIAKYKKMKELNEKDKVEKRPSNSTSDKLIVFYRNEFLAVRNAEGGFYVCQAMQNVYKSSSRIRIRWLSQQPDPSSDLYTPDFYDHTEFDCILTNLNLERLEKDKFRLPQAENRRTESILQRALDVERGVAPPPADDTLTETHPDGLDLSLYRNEEQLKKRKKNKKKFGRKRELSTGEEKRGSSSTRRRVVASSTISASAVAKAKKAAAIKRTAAVKRVVQQAAARKQASSAASSTGSNKKLVTSTALPNRASPANTATNSKKETKVQSSSVVSKRKAPAPSQSASVAPEKRSRRGNPVLNQNQSQSQTTTSSTAQGKSRGATVVSNSASNKHVTSSNSGASGNAANANSGATAGNARRTLRNSK